MTVLESFLSISAALVQAGVPPVSPYWRTEAERFYPHPTARLLVEMVGRGGDKSRTSVVMGIAETLGGDFDVPAGERHYFTHISENRDEAAKTLGIIEQYLRILGVPFDRAGDTIELRELPRGFKVLACRVGAVSGWRCIGWTADECAKWSNDGADPSEEVIASIRAMTVTHPAARGRMFSSPLGVSGNFHDTWALGTTPEQVAGQAASWQANPSITEERTHALERDPRKHAREYAAIPQAGALSAFDAGQVDRAMRTTVPGDWTVCGRVLLLDPTAGSSDTYAYAVAGWRKAIGGGQAVLEVTDVGGVAEAAAQGLTSADMVNSVSALARRHGATVVHSDQFERYALASAFLNRSLTFTAHAWTVQLKERAVEHVRGWLRDGLLSLPNHDRLRRELLSFEERISPSGALTFRGRQGGHDDYCMLVMLAALVDVEAGLAGSPTGTPMPGEGWITYLEGKVLAMHGRAPSGLIVETSPSDFIPMVAPDKYRCVTYAGRHATYCIAPDGLISAHPEDIPSLRLHGFVNAE